MWRWIQLLEQTLEETTLRLRAELQRLMAGEALDLSRPGLAERGVTTPEPPGARGGPAAGGGVRCSVPRGPAPWTVRGARCR